MRGANATAVRCGIKEKGYDTVKWLERKMSKCSDYIQVTMSSLYAIYKSGNIKNYT